MFRSVAEHVREIYPVTALEYDQLIASGRMGQFLTLIHELDLRGHEKVLDVGCGPGGATLKLAQLLPCGEVWGVDITDEMLEIAQQRARAQRLQNVQFRKEDAMALSFPDETFDIVFSSYLLPWVPQVDRALREMQRVLKPGGKLGIITSAPGSYGLFYKALAALIDHYREYYRGVSAEELIGAKRFTASEMQGKLLEIGLCPVKLWYTGYEEPTTPELYLKKINTVTAELYLAPLPQPLRSEARAYLLKSLEALREGELLAHERSLLLIARKRDQQ